MSWLVYVGVPVGLLVVVALYYYNRGVVLQNRCKEAWSNVDTELKRRYNLIPNLVEAVKGYARHEQAVMAEVTRTRSMAVRAEGSPHDQEVVERRFVAAVDRLLAVAEKYPELKASENFLKLQHELVITEDRIQAARRFYNANVRDQRDLLRQFPGNVFAAMYRFRERDFFEAPPLHYVAPAVVMSS